MSQQIHLAHLYPVEMNIYGDTGNRLVLQKRLSWRGIDVKTSMIGVGDSIPNDVDIIIGGGGQDAGQDVVQADLATKASALCKMADDGVVMLMVCGMYQLFGRRFVTVDGHEIKGIGILPLETIAGPKRLIGNTLYKTEWGEVIGYENHSGLTTLDDSFKSLAGVLRGDGNNGSDGTEGCLIKNVYGTYSHGPVLSKNPRFADELIRRALYRKYKTTELSELDDSIEHEAFAVAKTRPR